MARPKRDSVFTEIAGKTVESIKYQENPDYQVLELAFSDGTLLSFELSSRIEIQASYLKRLPNEPNTLRYLYPQILRRGAGTIL